MTWKESVKLVASIGVGKRYRKTDLCENARRYIGNMVARKYVINHGTEYEVTEHAVRAGEKL